MHFDSSRQMPDNSKCLTKQLIPQDSLTFASTHFTMSFCVGFRPSLLQRDTLTFTVDSSVTPIPYTPFLS